MFRFNFVVFFSLISITSFSLGQTPKEIVNPEIFGNRVREYLKDTENGKKPEVIELLQIIKVESIKISLAPDSSYSLTYLPKGNGSLTDKDLLNKTFKDIVLLNVLGNFKGGLADTETSKALIAAITIRPEIIVIIPPIIDPPTPPKPLTPPVPPSVAQVNPYTYWAMVPYYQPFVSYVKQGRLWNTQYVPFVINLPSYTWVQIFAIPNYQQPANTLPTIETVSVPANMNPDFSYQLGKQAYQERKLIEALEYFNHTLSLQPENAVAWHYRTVALYELGKVQMAQESAKRAGALFISHPENKSTILASLERIQGSPRSFLAEYRQTMTESEANTIVMAELPKDLLARKEQMLASAKK
jgi:tetratricopeptide (TPR) repeat protein